jgi:hypothetical protein
VRGEIAIVAGLDRTLRGLTDVHSPPSGRTS